ncbi:MAG: hypothetical protein EU547_07120, partial [Promethearchaeota archaeon]
MNKKAISIILIIIGGFLIAYPVLYVEYLKYNDLLEEPIDINLPQGIRLTIINNLDSSIAISWYSNKIASNPQVEYSLNPNLEDSLSITPNVSNISSFFIYHTEINNLEPNKTYFYQVSSDSQNFRKIMNFTTLSNNSNITRFLAYGDSRTQREEREMIAERIYENFLNKFDFLIHTGDIVADGRVQEQWNNYFNDTEILNTYKQGIFVEGNHERGEYSNAKMYDNLLMNS